MIAWTVIALRVLLLLLAAWCLKRTGSSLLTLWRGSQSLAEVGRAVQTFFALAVLVGQIFFLMWDQPPVLLLALTCSSIGLSLAIWTSKRAEAKGLHHLDAMIDRPDLALPLVELARFSEVEAQALAQQALRSIANHRLT